MVTLFNPTNETFTMMYAGIEEDLGPGKTSQADDAKARHLLSNFSQRGLCQLVFGDEKRLEEIAAAGRARNLEFKKTQVVRHNLMNEQRKATNQAYLTPTKNLQAYAAELGIQLLEPYALKDPNLNAVELMMRKNLGLEEKVNAMAKQNEELAGLVRDLLKAKEDPGEEKAPKKGKG